MTGGLLSFSWDIPSVYSIVDFSSWVRLGVEFIVIPRYLGVYSLVGTFVGSPLVDIRKPLLFSS